VAPRFELGIEALQAPALPLGYATTPKELKNIILPHSSYLVNRKGNGLKLKLLLWEVYHSIQEKEVHSII
jgi:hypothetical protein